LKMPPLGREFCVPGFNMSDYVTVAQRIAQFRERHPEGCLRPVNPAEPFKVVVIGDKTFITYAAAAFRTPDDTTPGIGVAWEPFPGKTPYTKESELMNAETSAWGRAIVAVLAGDTNVGIATQEDIRNRQAEVKDANDFVPDALQALTRDDLTKVYKAAGQAGALQGKVVHPGTGESMTLTQLFMKVGETFAHDKSSEAARSNSGTSRGAGK
jgi:hypothetical protein